MPWKRWGGVKITVRFPSSLFAWTLLIIAVHKVQLGHLYNAEVKSLIRMELKTLVDKFLRKPTFLGKWQPVSQLQAFVSHCWNPSPARSIIMHIVKKGWRVYQKLQAQNTLIKSFKMGPHHIIEQACYGLVEKCKPVMGMKCFMLNCSLKAWKCQNVNKPN